MEALQRGLVNRDEVISILRNAVCSGSGIPMDLALVKRIKIFGHSVEVTMNLPEEGCPAEHEIVQSVKNQLIALDNVRDVRIRVLNQRQMCVSCKYLQQKV